MLRIAVRNTKAVPAFCAPFTSIVPAGARIRRSHNRVRRALATAAQNSVITAAADGPANHPTSAYIHLPFCAKRCHYCAFPVVVSGRSALPTANVSGNIKSTPGPLPAHVAYIDLLCREIRSFFRLRARLRAQNRARTPSSVGATHPARADVLPPLQTLYFGGGTPSLLHPTLLARVLSTLNGEDDAAEERANGGDSGVLLAPGAEVTAEMDPATFTPDTAAAFAALGVTRASVGVQSFDDGALAACGRAHRAADVAPAVRALRAAGFASVSLDLIAGLPEVGRGQWERSVYAALALEPDHLSVYDLALEAGTPFARRLRAGVAPLPDEGDAAHMLQWAGATLRAAGFEHYEISNFAATGTAAASATGADAGAGRATRRRRQPRRSRHNMAYWRGEPFYAFGLGATSLVDGVRFARPRRMGDYARYVDELERAAQGEGEGGAHGSALFAGVERQSERDALEDTLINGLRLLVDGVSVDDVRARFGPDAARQVANGLDRGGRRLEENGLVEMFRGTGGVVERVRLTTQGAMVENEVVSDLLLATVWQDGVPS